MHEPGKMFGVAVLSGKKGDDSEPQNDGESAANDLLEAIQDKDPAAVLSAFELLYEHCAEKHDSDSESDDDDETEPMKGKY